MHYTHFKYTTAPKMACLNIEFHCTMGGNQYISNMKENSNETVKNPAISDVFFGGGSVAGLGDNNAV